MTPERWARIKALFNDVIDLDPANRRIRLTSSCADDPALIEEVEALVASDARDTPDRLTASLAETAATALAAAPDPMIGAHLGPFRIAREIGRGGMGRVYEAHRVGGEFEQRVAIKIVAAGLDRADLLRRFAAERRIVAGLTHPNIARVFDGGATPDGAPYFVMEYVDGLAIDAYCVQRHLEVPARLRLLRQVSLAVAYAHSRLVVHRDLKPSNVLVCAGDDPMLLDFGIAKVLDADDEATLTHGAARAMTPAYASPEQIRGEPATTATDVYSLGVLCYEVLTGLSPYEAATGDVAALERAICGSDPPKPSRIVAALRGDVDAIVLKALRKDPEDRYPTALALAEDLTRALAGEPVVARPVGPFTRLVKRGRRHPVTAALLLATVAGFTTLTVMWVDARRSSDRQAALAAQLGQDVQRIETTMRLGEMVPLHDLSHERERIRAQMRRIETLIASIGAPARAPGWYALGRGWLALRDHTAARLWLERAWQAGYHTPEAAYALGLTFGRLYREALAEAETIGNATIRQSRRDQASADLRAPAVEYLRLASDADLAAPEYVVGLLALYEGRYEEARAESRKAAARAAWFHEAHVLDGDALALGALQARDAGRYDDASGLFSEAAAAYTRALQVAPSAPLTSLQACMAASGHMEMEMYRHVESVGALRTAAVTACDRSLAADGRSAAAHAQRARVFHQWARFLINQGQGEPDAALREAAASARAAIDIDASAANLRELGLVFALQGQADYDFGRDPRPASAKAASYLERAIALEPSLAFPHFTYGLALWNQGAWEKAHGINPQPSLQRGAAQYERAITLAPSLGGAYASLGGVYGDLADYQDSQGQDPEALLDKAVATYMRGLAVNPNDVGCLNNLGNASIRRAERALARGLDPVPMLHHAIAQHSRVREIAPKLYVPYANLGEAALGLARARLDRGADPAPDISRALGWLAEAQAINRERPAPDSRRAHAFRLEASFERLSGRDPMPAVGRGLTAARAALAKNPEFVEAHVETVRLLLEDADAALATGRAPGRALAEVRRSVARLRAINADSSLAAALSAEGLVRESRAARGPAAESAARAALAEAQQALRPNLMNPTLAVTLARASRQFAATAPDPTTARRALDEGLAVVEKALSAAAGRADLLAERSALLGARASSPDSADARESLAALDRALAINPLLSRDYPRFPGISR